MKIGRPPEYSEKILVKARAYLKECTDKIEEYHKTRGEKSDTYERHLKVKLPTIEGLAVYLGVSRRAIYDWESQKDKKEFLYILEELRAMQAERLINNSLSGDYNHVIAKVLLTKHGYREGVDQTTNGKDLPTPIMPLPNHVHTDDSNSESRETEEED